MATIIGYDKYSKEVLKVKKLGITSYTERKYEPQTQNTFAFEFLFDSAQVAYIGTYANNQISPITGAEKIDVNNYNKGLSQINEVLNASLDSLTSPTKTLGTIMIDYFNSQIKFAGKPTYNNASISFNTLVGLGTKNVLAGWNDLCQSDRTMAGGWGRTLPNYKPDPFNESSENATEYLDKLFSNTGYKVDGIMLECARDGSIVNSWKYIGMWVQTFTPGNYSMAGSTTPARVSTTIVVDKIEQSDFKYIESSAV
mgnify:CR=1 FL=1